MSDKLLDALKKLDTRNDNHWTADKLPRVETVRLLAADQTITREDIDTAAQGFTRDTAAAYWLTYAPPADSAAAGATGPAGATDSTGQGVSNPPQDDGAGAETQAATQGEGTKATSTTEGADGSGTDAPGAPEQSAMEITGTDGEDDLESLEAELEATKASIAEGRAYIDRVKDEIRKIEAREQELANKIDLLKRESGVNPNANAIQMYLAQQQKTLAERGARKALIKESGIDLAELTKGLKSPLDAAMARKTGRGGQRPTR